MPLFKHTPHPHIPRNTNAIHKAEQATASLNQRLAVFITECFGTMTAFYVLVIWMFLWMTLASMGFWLFKDDPWPFPFLLFCSNLIQLWALPVLAVGQRVLSHSQELQADEAYNLALKNEHEIAQIAAHLAAQDEELAKQSTLLKKLCDEVVRGSNGSPG